MCSQYHGHLCQQVLLGLRHAMAKEVPGGSNFKMMLGGIFWIFNVVVGGFTFHKSSIKQTESPWEWPSVPQLLCFVFRAPPRHQVAALLVQLLVPFLVPRHFPPISGISSLSSSSCSLSSSLQLLPLEQCGSDRPFLVPPLDPQVRSAQSLHSETEIAWLDT